MSKWYAANPRLIIGLESSEYVSIQIIRRCYPEATDYDDGNWLDVQIEVRAGAWFGRFKGCLRAEEFEAFRHEIAALHEQLEGTAEFSPMEPWINLKLSGNGRGGIELEGEAIDQVGTGNTLKFGWEMDQTYLPGIIRALDSIIGQFPVVGRK